MRSGNFFLEKGLKKTWFYPEDFRTAVGYSVGLITVTGKPYLKSIQTQTGFQVVNLSSYLGELGWESDLFNSERESCFEDGETILDEVVLPKENTKKSDASLTYYSSQKRLLQGQEYLVLIWTKGSRTVVIGLKKVDKKDNKINQSIELVEQYLKLGIKTKGLRCDGWFFKDEFVNRLKDRIEIISRPRRDGKWYLGADIIKLSEFAGKIPPECFHYYSNQKVYGKGFTVFHEKYGECKVVIVKPRRSSPLKDWQFIVSTNPDLTVREMIIAMKTRWKIEVLFRDCSQNLGLKGNQCNKPGSTERHVAMVFLTYNFLSKLKEKEGSTIGKIKRKLASGWNLRRTSKANLFANIYAA